MVRFFVSLYWDARYQGTLIEDTEPFVIYHLVLNFKTIAYCNHMDVMVLRTEERSSGFVEKAFSHTQWRNGEHTSQGE